jgi:hypothetical protein
MRHFHGERGRSLARTAAFRLTVLGSPLSRDVESATF